MSSATSIDKVLAHKGGGHGPRSDVDDQPADAGFRAWHFFVLASLIAATAAVVIVRQSTPENVVLISITIGAAGAAAAAFYRMLAPLAAEDVTLFSETLSHRQRAALEREKTLVLRSIKELEFDRAMGKLSTKDFEEMSGRLRTRALSLMRDLDEGGSGYREIIERELMARVASLPARTKLEADGASPHVESETAANVAVGRQTCTCGTANDEDAAFCKRCGTRLS